VIGADVQLASLFSHLDLFKIWKILVTSVGTSIRANDTASLRLTEFVTPQDSGGLTETYADGKHYTSLLLYSGRRRSDLGRIHYGTNRMIQNTSLCPK
jgi:hypothetical protein